MTTRQCAALLRSGAQRPVSTQVSFQQAGDGWCVTYGGRTVWLGHLVGMVYLAELLARPHRSLAATALLRVRAAGAIAGSLQACGVDPQRPGHAGELLDERARRAYGARMRELRAELEGASRDHDLGRAERLQCELECLHRELSRAVGLSGRARTAGSPAERARVSVTRAIRKAIVRIERAHPELAEHLRASIKTGRECSYQPIRAEHIQWLT